MASIFLSYAHGDRRRAEKIAQALERAGHSVWWDQQIHAGSRFSKDIDTALRKADLVVVLWSKTSIESSWVHDEAAYGRDKSCLVPVLVDNVEPPLGFRQYQAIKVGRSNADAVVRAVTSLLSAKGDTEQPQVKQPQRRYPLGAAVAFLVLLVIAVGGWWGYQRFSGSSRTVLIVEPSKGANSPTSAIIIDQLIENLKRFGEGPIAALDVEPPGTGASATYRAQVRFSESERHIAIEVVLKDRNGDRLWSTSLEGEAFRQADLVREAAGRLGAALVCDLDQPVRDHELAHEVRALYLEGCARLADATSERDDKAIGALRQVVERAPKFGPGWAHLALAEFMAVPTTPIRERSNLVWTSGRHTEMALRLDPSLPEPFYIKAFGRRSYPGLMADALPVVEDGLRRNPDNALLIGARAEILANFGMVREALDHAKRAIALNPLSPARLTKYVLLLAYDGKLDAARQQLDEAQQNWPRSMAVAELRYLFDLRYGDPANALRMIRDGEAPAESDEGHRLYLEARISPTPSNIEAVLTHYRKVYEMEPAYSFAYIQALGTFGRVDEAYRVFASPDAVEPFTRYGEGLFRPYMRSIRTDPRFMSVAHRSGMLAFWRKSGVWPDFCRDPQLKYDCRREAVKYSNAAQ